VKYTVIDSPVGLLTLVSGPNGLVAIQFGRHAPPGFIEDRGGNQAAILQLGEYFSGRRRAFDLKLVMSGTAFQRAVWGQLTRIPWGETRSYGDVAASIGKLGAGRAVGMANNRNPLPIIIPCHRVIGSDGSLTGYAGGIGAKARLLALEGALPVKEHSATSHSRGRSTEPIGAL
jgi:methylated-DNA-[protein]-cysteine S-methyltransferase